MKMIQSHILICETKTNLSASLFLAHWLFKGLFGCVCLVTVYDFAMKMSPIDTLQITWREARGSG